MVELSDLQSSEFIISDEPLLCLLIRFEWQQQNISFFALIYVKSSKNVADPIRSHQIT